MKTKQLLSLLFLCLSPIVADAQTEFTADGFTYRVLEGNTVALTRVPTETEGSVVVPSTVVNEGKSYTVTQINNGEDRGAFYSCAKVTAITIPASVTTIAGWLAYDATNCDEVTFLDGEKPLLFTHEGGEWVPFVNLYLGRDIVSDHPVVFFNRVQNVTVGPTVTAIPAQMFKGNNYLVSIDLSKATSLATIGNEAFSNCYNQSLTNIDLSKTKVENIGDYAFYSCTHLATVDFPNTLQTIGNRAFYYCYALEGMTIPASVNTIGDEVFYYADTMKYFTIEDSANPLTFGMIGAGLQGENFYLGRNITYSFDADGQVIYLNVKHVTLGPNVTAISDNMFRERNIETIDLTKATSLKSIGAYAFYGCRALDSLTIPASVDSFQGTALWSVYSDKPFTLTIEDCDRPLIMTRGEYCTIENPPSVDIYIGSNLQRSEESYDDPMFGGNVTSVEFGPKVTYIMPYLIWSGNEGLTSVKTHAVTPVALPANIFNNTVYTDATLWVPGGTVADYKAADNWKQFACIKTWSYVINFLTSAVLTFPAAQPS